MLQIALCDDEAKHLSQMTTLLEDYFQARPSLKGKVSAFLTGSELIAQAEAQGGFDLYVLDILMPGLDGIETGRQLRQLGDGGEILFLTTSNDFAADSYDVHAFFYLLKPVDTSKLFQVLDGAVKKLNERRNSAIVVSTAEGPRRILRERIRYVERTGRFMRYFCTDGTVDTLTIRIPFREMVAPLLADRRFYLCGASFVLNFQHVTGVKDQTAFLDNGQTLTLPRSAVAAFKLAWGNYWLSETESLENH